MRRFSTMDTSGQPIQWHVIKLLWPYLLAFKKRILWALLFLVLAKLASISLPFFLKYIVDSLDATISGAVNVADQLNQNLLTAESAWLIPMSLVCAYGAARFLNVLFNELRDTLFGRVTEGTMRNVGLRAFEHLHKLELDFHLNRRTGGLSRDLERGTTAINSLMRFMVFNIIPTLIEVGIVVCIMLVKYGWPFALTILLSVVAYVLFSIKATEWRTGFVREANLADSDSHARAVDSLLNYETVKYFNNEAYEAERYDETLAEWEQARRKNRLSLFALNGGQALIIACGTTTMLALAANDILKQEMTLGDFVLVNAFMMQIFIPLNFLGFVYREIKGSLAGLEALFSLMGTTPKVTEPSNAKDIVLTGGAIKFDKVSFAYHPDRKVLKGLSFELNAGERVAIVGPSGSGKSTLIKLLFRFYDPVDGEILIDGQNISQVGLDSLRKSIGIVPQEAVLFNDTIKENVRYGRPGATDTDVEEAIRMAHLSDFIDGLPDGLETKVGERGLKLSGGEKQRVAIARTLLKEPVVWVFDEATSSLDSRSEKAILSAINDASEGHTTLVIAHRLSTVVDADRILVVENGVLVEQGSHQELLTARGLYHHLWHAQQRQADAESNTPLT